ERKAIRENPAVIPKLGAFFVHDDRSGAAGGAAGQETEEQEGAEEESTGRWRADAVPSVKKKSSGERWARGKKPVSPPDDDDLPWGHEGFEEVMRAEEEGRPISNTSGFWSNPTGKGGRSGSWRGGGGGGGGRSG
ncbi:unnamed protein product, partial [Laminaria digitata]